MSKGENMVERCAGVVKAKLFEMQRRTDTITFEEIARAVLAELREPTNAMKYVGGTKCEDMMFGGDPEYTGIIFTDMGVVFRDMIDAALSQPNDEGDGK